MRALGLVVCLLLSPSAQAVDADVGGYMRISTRPDFQGGDGKLGYWNLYGRLLNESSWVALETRLSLLDEVPGTHQDWAAIHARVEGASILNGDSGAGGLGNMRLSQLYALVGNPSNQGLEWQLGTLQHWTGDLGLYDMRPDSLFDETLGGAAHYRGERISWMLAIGDAGYGLDPEHYNTVLAAGGRVRWHVADGLELGVGFEGRHEPAVQGNVNAPYGTPDMGYEAYLRGEVVSDFVAANPDQELLFPKPEARDAQSWKATGYLGFGGFGPLVWNSFYVRLEQHHPESQATETFEGQDYILYLTDITDERSSLLLGNEMALTLIPGRLDAVWAMLVGRHTDGDNGLAPSEHEREYASTVLRLQTYLSPTVHWLLENSFAVEYSPNGNAYRNHVDSIFASAEGISDSRGLEVGDADTRQTWQGKTGIVLNPLGPGVYVRPSIRLLYGLQYSTQHAAWGGSFVDSLDQYGDFYSGADGLVDRRWHQVFALEAEAWF
jgi:hypothetical protein